MNLNRGDYDEVDFNKRFEQAKELASSRVKENERLRLENLNSEITQKNITQLSVIEILIGIKDTWFELIDDLLQRKFNSNTFTKENRLFYIGVTIIVIVIFIYLFSIFTSETIDQNNSNKIVKIYHVYQNGNPNFGEKNISIDQITDL